MSIFRQFVLANDDVNEALGVAGREARTEVPGYGGSARRDDVVVRPLAPGYSGFPKRRAKARAMVPGYGPYGTAPVTVQITRLQNS